MKKRETGRKISDNENESVNHAAGSRDADATKSRNDEVVDEGFLSTEEIEPTPGPSNIRRMHEWLGEYNEEEEKNSEPNPGKVKIEY